MCACGANDNPIAYAGVPLNILMRIHTVVCACFLALVWVFNLMSCACVGTRAGDVMYIYVYTYIHTYICIHIYTYIYIYICVYIYVYSYTYIHTHTHIIYISIYVNVRIYMCICIYICTYIHMQKLVDKLVHEGVLPQAVRPDSAIINLYRP